MSRRVRFLALTFAVLALSAVGLGAFLASTAQAGPCDVATKTWDRGASTDSWHDANNWAPNGVPAAGEHVCITAGAPGSLVVAPNAVNIGSVESAKPLRIQSTFAVTSTGQTSSFSTLELQGDLNGAGSRTVTTALNWRSGTLSGGGSTTVGGTTTIENVSANRTLSSTLTTNGPVNQSGPVTYVYLANGTWNNGGAWTINYGGGTGANWYSLIDNGGTNLVHNTGTITKSGNSAALMQAPVDNDGTVTATDGTLDISGGSGLPAPAESTGEWSSAGIGVVEIAGTRFGTGSNIAGSGSGAVSATGTNSVVGTMTGSPGGTLRLDGTLDVAVGAAIDSLANFTWRSGTLSGGGSTTVGGTTLIENSGQTRTLSSVLTTNGAVSQGGSAAYVYLANGTWNNGGAWTINYGGGTGANWYSLIDNGGTNLVHNTGTITKSGNSTALMQAPVDNDGTITATDGTLDISTVLGYDGGASTLSGGTWAVSSGGFIDLGNVANVQTLDATFIADGAGSQIRNASNANVLPGIRTITSSGGLTVRNGQALTLTSTLNTAGTVTVGATSGLTTTGQFTQTNGTTRLETNTASLTATGSRVEVQGGTLGGVGTVAPELRSTGGTIAPGNSPGTLFVTGPVNLASTANVAVEINGPNAGTDHDRIQASGAVSVNGTLTITKGAAYNPAVGQTFDVITGSSRTGTFSGVTPTSAGTGKGFDVTYPAGKVTLAVVAVPGQDLVVSAAPLSSAFNVGYPGSWRATVSNVGGAATSGTITATFNLGVGQSLNSANGNGWSCSGSGPVTCTRSGAVASGASLPPIDLSVGVSAAAQPSTTLNATISGGGDTRPGNNGFTTSVTVRNNVPPIAQLQLSGTKGTAPFSVTADSTLSTGTITTRSFDWGDGSSSTGLVANHTYAQPGIYTITLRVENDVQSATRTQRVTVVENVPLAADAGDDRAAAPGLTLQFDGGGSEPAADIDTYAWDFGDGSSTSPSANATAFRSYATTGTFTATLTVTRGAATSTDTLEVTVEPAVGTGVVIDVTGSGSPLPGADVTVIDAFGVRYSAVANLSGTALLKGLPNGAYTAYAWADGFVPKAAPITVTGGNGSADIDLASGAIATQTLESRRLTYDEIVAAGIDPADPANQNIFEFTICLAFGEYSCIPFEGLTNGGELFFPTFGGGPGGGPVGTCDSDSCSWSSSGSRISATTSVQGGQPSITFLLIPGEARWLKEFFEVKMAVVNLAPPAFTFEEGVATLDLPEGLALAPTADPQSLDYELDDIPGGQSGTATWIIRGDTEGEYDLAASYSGTLDPVGKSVKLTAVTAEPLKVWGGSAVEMTVIADDSAVEHEPYRFTLRLENVTDGSGDPAPVYNPVLAIDEDAGGTNYIVQPAQRFEQGTDVLDPGETFEADFVIVPNANSVGPLNVAGSAVLWAAGEEAPSSSVISQPRQAALAVTPTALPGQVQLDWAATPGAVEYRVYRTATDLTTFPVPAAPLTTVAGTTAAVAAPQGAQWYAISSVDTNGVAAMHHELIEAAPAAPPAGPTISVDSAQVIEGNSGKVRNAQLAVVLSQPSTQPVTVKYAIEADGTATAATAATDFKTKTGTLTFNPNGAGLTPTTRYITVQAIPDVLVEGNESFRVRLFDPSPGYALGAANGVVTIADDDPSTGLRVSVSDASMLEGDSGVNARAVNNGKVWVTFSNPVTVTTTVKVTITAGTATEGTDYKLVKTKILTFNPGQFQKAVSVPVFPDTVGEADETVTITLSEPSAGVTIAKPVGTFTIVNDD